VLRVQSFLVALHQVNGSDRTTTAPSLLASTLASAHDLQVVELPIELPTFDLKMTWHERTHADPGLRWFRRAMVDAAQSVLRVAGAATPDAQSP